MLAHPVCLTTVETKMLMAATLVGWIGGELVCLLNSTQHRTTDAGV